MRAGLLREHLKFQAQTKTQSASGAVTSTWTDICTLRAWKKNVVAGEQFNQKELFTSERWTFQMRYVSTITSDMRVIYNGVTYKIVGVPDRQIQDNTMIITITKIDQ
jgi:SPP1 family predicted phage head-tail adaptor